MSYNEWSSVALGDIGKIVTGKTPSSKNKDYFGNKYKFITPRDMNGYKKINFTERYLSEEGLQTLNTQIIKGKSVLVSCIGSDMGKVAIVEGTFITNQQINTITEIGEQFYADFIYYALLPKKNYLHSIAGGSTMPIVNKSRFSEIEIRMPTLGEQKAIAHVLSTFDEKIEVNNKINKTLESMAQAIFKNWFIDFEFSDENGNPYRSSGGKMIENELGEIPEGWKTVCLSEIGDIVAGGTPSKIKNEYYENGNIAWITPKDLSGNKSVFISEGATNITELGLKKSSAKILPKYSVLFSSRAPIGYVAINKNEVCTNQGFKSIVPNDGIPYQFVYFYLKNNIEFIESIAGGSTFKEISGNAMKNLKVTLPPMKLLKEYRQIVETIFNNIENFEDASQILSKLRDSLIPKLLSGEIEIPTEEEA